MKKLFTFIVGAVVGLGAYAQDFDSGGLYYSVLSPDDKTCVVTGCYELGSVLEIPDIVQFEGEDYTVTEIGHWAFQGLSFTSLSLPSTLETIRDGGFYNSYQLTELVIPNSVKEIGSYSFAYSGSLQRVVLGSSVEVINYNAFAYCDQLSVVVPEGETPARFGDGYSNSFPSNPLVTVSENLIDDYKAAWEGANVVANVEAESVSFDPDSYTVTPGGSVQLNCVVVPSNAPVKFSTWNRDVITVDNNGLVTADNLRGGFNVGITATSLNGITAKCSIEIESVEEFESDGLVFVVLNGTENEVALIRYESTSTVVNIPETVEYNGNLYSVTTIGNDVFRSNDNIEEVVIPSSVKLIREENFNYCGQLKKVHIADSATPLKLSNYNFTDDGSLTEIYVGRELAYSEETTCFRWIYSLSSVVLGPEVNSLPANIFGDCYNLNFIESKNPVPPVLGENAFGYNNLTIIVPAESVEAYRSAWEQYESYIIDTVDATELSFETDEVTIYNGQNIKLPLVVEPEGATVIWSSSNPDLVHVDNEGNISYYSGSSNVGEAVITASSINGLTAECKVTAKHWLTFAEDNVTLTPGSTYPVEVTKPEQLAESTITWISNNESVATVDENGVITAVAGGDAEIEAKVIVSFDEYWAEEFSYSIQVNVRSEVTSVTPVDPVITVWVDNSTPIDLLFEPDDEYVNREMTWEVADPEIAEVFSYENGNGYSVRGLKPGNTTITGTTANGISVDIEVAVKAEVYDIIFPSYTTYVGTGQARKLEFTTNPEVTNQTFTFTSSDENIVTVDEDGVITGHEVGRTEIGVWAETPWGGQNVWWHSVEVAVAPESVKFVGSSDYEGNLSNYTWFQLEFTPDNPDVSKHIDWTAEDPEIVYMDSNDNSFIGRKFGTTTFKGIALNGEVLEGTITIAGIELLVDGVATGSIDANIGNEIQLDVNASSEELLANLTFVSDDPAVASVNEDGLVTAIACGTTYVRAETWIEVNGERKSYSNSIHITVMPETGIIFNKSEVGLSQDDYWAYLTVIRAMDVEKGYVSWTSSDYDVVDINWSNEDQAELRFKAPGHATITATDENGNVATCEVTCYGLEIIPSEFGMYTNSTYQLQARILPEDVVATEPINWYTNDWWLNVDENGLVTTNETSGTAYINANTNINGVYVSGSSYVTVEMSIPVAEIILNETSIPAEVGTEYHLTATIYPEDATFKDLIWTSSDESVATVNEDGWVTIVSDGYAVITASATDGSGVTATCEVTKTVNYPENVELLNDDIKVVFRHETPLNVVFTPNDADVNKEMTWTVDNPEIAEVITHIEWDSDLGQDVTTYAVSGKGLGTTTIVGTTGNGLTVTGYVSVEGVDIYYGSRDARNLYISVGETVQLEIEANPEDLRNTIEFVSYDENLFTVTEDGLVTGVAPGNNWIDAKYVLNGEQYYDDIYVYVSPASGNISLSRKQLTIQAGNPQTLQVNFAAGEEYDITWETSNPDIVGINAYGSQAEIYFVGIGTATVTARASNGATATCEVTCVDLTLNNYNIVMAIDQTRQLEVSGVPEDVDYYVNWYTTNYGVAYVENGLITSVGYGTAQIQGYVYSYDGLDLGSVYANVEVIDDFVYVTDIFLDPNQIDIEESMLGQTIQILAAVMPEDATDNTLSWSSSDESVVRVDQNGLVTIVSRGEAVITASAIDGSGVVATCQVNKVPLEIKVKSIELSEEEWEGVVGESIQLNASVKPSYATDRRVTWSSSNESVATVDNQGKVKAIAVGTAIITATSQAYTNIQATCQVTVKEPVLVESLTITPESWSGEKDEEFTIEATILPDNATYKTLSFESNDNEVATVDNNGQVTLVGEGTCVIKVSTTDGSHLTAECQVTVNAAPVLAESMTITPDQWSGEEEGSFRIEATVMPEDTADKAVSFESSDTTVATVDSEGVVTVLKEGTCVITVSTTDGSNLTAECLITGLSGIAWIMSDSDASIDVYTQQGVLIKHNCTVDDLKLLQSDIYIIRRGNTVKTIYLRN